MIKEIIALFSLLIIFNSCTSRSGNNNQVQGGDTAIEASISDILSDPLVYDNKTVIIEGTISHVCRHSGDKMRVLQDGSDLSILVMLGGFTGRFSTESEGARVLLEGTLVTEVTNLDELNDHMQEHGHEGDHECESTLEAIEAMKARGLDANMRSYIALNHFETK